MSLSTPSLGFHMVGHLLIRGLQRPRAAFLPDPACPLHRKVYCSHSGNAGSFCIQICENAPGRLRAGGEDAVGGGTVL